MVHRFLHLLYHTGHVNHIRQQQKGIERVLRQRKQDVTPQPMAFNTDITTHSHSDAINVSTSLPVWCSGAHERNISEGLHKYVLVSRINLICEIICNLYKSKFLSRGKES